MPHHRAHSENQYLSSLPSFDTIARYFALIPVPSLCSYPYIVSPLKQLSAPIIICNEQMALTRNVYGHGSSRSSGPGDSKESASKHASSSSTSSTGLESASFNGHEDSLPSGVKSLIEICSGFLGEIENGEPTTSTSSFGCRSWDRVDPASWALVVTDETSWIHCAVVWSIFESGLKNCTV
jgi:hypothetical protein